MEGLEPSTSCSQSKRTTKLYYTQIRNEEKVQRYLEENDQSKLFTSYKSSIDNLASTYCQGIESVVYTYSTPS